jgi:hypothetical protein
MKKIILFILSALFISYAGAQTATNFTSNDCSGTNHDLFTELDAGKVIVLDWVMPCGACVSASLTTYNVVQSYASSHPNTVQMYLCDDYANTNCTSLNSWKSANGLANAVTFSNASIDMMDYSSTGMPKVVVLGGSNHTVFYNANNAVNVTSLQNAINSALLTTGIQCPGKLTASLAVMPNPSSHQAQLKFTMPESANVTAQLFNLEGKLLRTLFTGKAVQGENQVTLNTAELASAMYLVKLTDGAKSDFINLVVSH